MILFGVCLCVLLGPWRAPIFLVHCFFFVWISIIGFIYFLPMSWARNECMIGLPIRRNVAGGSSLQPVPVTKLLNDFRNSWGALTPSNPAVSENTHQGKPGTWLHFGSLCVPLAQVNVGGTPRAWPDWKVAITFKFTWRYTWEMCKTVVLKRGLLGRTLVASRQRAVFLLSSCHHWWLGTDCPASAYSWGFSKEFSINFIY